MRLDWIMVGLFPSCEFRSLNSGTSKAGKPFNIVRWEDSKGESFEAWVAPEVAQSFMALNKGDEIELIVRLWKDRRGYTQVAVDGFNYPAPLTA